MDRVRPQHVRDRRNGLAGLLGLVLALALLNLFPSPAAQQEPPEGRVVFGTLLTDSSRAALEKRNGIGVAHLEMRWDRYEPEDGVFDSDYGRSIRAAADRFHRAGLRVEAGFGLNYPPAWLVNSYPGAGYSDQYGDRYTEAANLVFSQRVRAGAQAYIDHVAKDIGLGGIWSIRVGVDSNGEFSYPPTDAGDGRANAYWAFDQNAQAQGPDPDRPPGIPANPFPGWQPGEHIYQDRAFTTTEVRAWYEWYLAALADAVNWQIDYYRSLSFTGFLKVLVPGTGYYPSDYSSAVDRYLDGTVAPPWMGLGVGFFRTIPMVHQNGIVQIASTSLADNSGSPQNNACEISDTQLDITSASADPTRQWSSVRWVSYLAGRSGFELAGETAGPNVAPYYQGVMDVVARQVKACGLNSLMWAFDFNLYDDTPGASLKDYAAMIKQFPQLRLLGGL